MEWLLMLFLVIGGFVILNMYAEPSIGEDEDLEVYMAPGSGRIFLFNPKTNYVEHPDYGVFESSGKKEDWLLVEIGEFYSANEGN